MSSTSKWAGLLICGLLAAGCSGWASGLPGEEGGNPALSALPPPRHPSDVRLPAPYRPSAPSSPSSAVSLPPFIDLGFPRQELESGAIPPHDLNLPVPEGESADEAPQAQPASPGGEQTPSFVFEVPILRNALVERWVDYFTGPGRDLFAVWLQRGGRYLPYIRQILKEEGVPEDLAYVPLIESGFSLRARSRAGAVGPWQFMEGTARRMGLRVDRYLDERRDPMKSTRAAASYLTYLHKEFGDWHLALAAYNAGENRIRSAIRESGLSTYWALARTSHLPIETKNYVGKFIAGMMLAKHPEVFGFAGLEYDEPLRYDMAKLPHAVSLRMISQLAGVPIQELADLNPHLRLGITPPGGGFGLRLPPGKTVLLLQRLAKAPREAHPAPSGYRIQPGDTLSGIAKRFNLPLRQLLELNPRLDPRRLRPGTQVNLPASGTRAEAEPPASPPQETHHVVGPGENIWTISRIYGVSPEDIIRWNSLSTSSVIFPGDRLLVRRQ